MPAGGADFTFWILLRMSGDPWSPSEGPPEPLLRSLLHRGSVFTIDQVEGVEEQRNPTQSSQHLKLGSTQTSEGPSEHPQIQQRGASTHEEMKMPLRS